MQSLFRVWDILRSVDVQLQLRFWEASKVDAQF